MKKRFMFFTACVVAIALSACSGGGAASQTESAPPSLQAAASRTAAPSSSQASAQPESSSSAASGETSSGSLSAASQPAEEQTPGGASDPVAESTPSESTEEQTGKALVVYFSWSGNTESVAREIKNQTGADSFKILPAASYTDDYDALLEIAQEEQRDSARPAISGSVDLSGYDTIYLGYPIWWGDMPMILYTFLDNYDLSGKTVAPFCTSGGSGLSGSVGAIRSAEPGAAVLDGLHIGSGSASNPSDAVSQWLAGQAQ